MSDTVKLLAFAGAREMIGEAELAFPVGSGLTARGLLDAVCARFPRLWPYAGSIRVAINGTYAAWDEPVRPGDEVALIPPVAGG